MPHVLWRQQQAELLKIQVLQMGEEEEGDMVLNLGGAMGEEEVVVVVVVGLTHLEVVEGGTFRAKRQMVEG